MWYKVVSFSLSPDASQRSKEIRASWGSKWSRLVKCSKGSATTEGDLSEKNHTAITEAEPVAVVEVIALRTVPVLCENEESK